MPKMRTHKGAQKRFKLSANGVVLRAKGQKSHMRRRKPNRRQSDPILTDQRAMRCASLPEA